jgi:hypothetical protein
MSNELNLCFIAPILQQCDKHSPIDAPQVDCEKDTRSDFALDTDADDDDVMAAFRHRKCPTSRGPATPSSAPRHDHIDAARSSSTREPTLCTGAAGVLPAF